MENKSTRIMCLLLGPILFALCILLIPSDNIDLAIRVTVGTIVWMSVWWVTGPVDYAVTGFLPIAVNALFHVTDMSSITANYASETILLLLGASIITVTWEETGLEKRIAAAFMGFIGNGFRKQILFWFLLSAGLSALLPNAVVCATLTPIAFSMLKFIGESDIPNSKVGSKILLVIAYGAGVGGMATPLGGAMNLVVVDYIQQITETEFMYIDWVVRFIPIILVLLVSNLIVLLIGVKPGEQIGDSREYFTSNVVQSGKMSREEKYAFWLFAIATILSFTRQLYVSILPGLKPAYVFMICAIISFVVTKSDGSRLLLWKNAQTKIGWDMIYIFAGGLALGTMVNNSGTSRILGREIAEMGLTGGFMTIVVIITITLIMSDLTSNTATAAVSIPIIISIIEGIDKNPIPYIYIATIGVNLSYCLPTSIRAIPVGYGLAPRYMLRTGWKMTLVVIALESALCYVLLTYWPAFSLAS